MTGRRKVGKSEKYRVRLGAVMGIQAPNGISRTDAAPSSVHPTINQKLFCASISLHFPVQQPQNSLSWPRQDPSTPTPRTVAPSSPSQVTTFRSSPATRDRARATAFRPDTPQKSSGCMFQISLHLFPNHDPDPTRRDRTDRAVLAVNGFAADGNMFVKKVKQRLEVLPCSPPRHRTLTSRYFSGTDMRMPKTCL